MFEGTLPSVSPHGSAKAGAMRAVAWPELVAKFAAARDLRTLWAGGTRQSLASFATGAAGALGHFGDVKPPVNPDALVDGKGLWARTIAAADDARDGDREMQ